MIKHFTATAYLVAKIDREYRVLLHKHKKIGIWVGIGGHIEEDENPIEAVIREVKEETGLDFEFIAQGEKLLKSKEVLELPLPFIFQEEEIPKYKDIPTHKHLDFIYFGFVKNTKRTKIKEDFGWFNRNELKKLNLLQDIERSARKALEIVKHEPY